MAKDNERLRLVINFLLYFIWTILIAYNLFASVENSVEVNKHKYKVGFGVLTAVSFLFQIAVVICSIWKRYHSKYVNLPLVAFIFLNMTQYGFGLFHTYQNISHYQHQKRNPHTCLNLEEDLTSYVIYFSTIPILILANLLYPLPSQDRMWYKDLQNGIATLDILDLAELIVLDFGCIVAYNETVFLVVFYIAIAVSAFLVTTTRGLEQSNADDEEKYGIDTLVTILNIVFNDALFLVLRLYVMVKSGEIGGMVFVVKEVITLTLRTSLLYSKQE